MNHKLLLLLLLFSIQGGDALGCEKTYSKYYSWAELKMDPPRPAREIPESEAILRESDGKAYYIGTYCSDGKIHTLEKRWDKKPFFKFIYNYKEGHYIGTTSMKVRGK